MTMPLKDRLIHAREQSGFSEPATVAKRVGLTPSALYQLESGTTKTLSGLTAVKLGRAYPSFRLEWLIEGTGPAKRNDHRLADDPAGYARGAEPETRPGYVRLHLMDGTASGGDGAVNTDFPEVVRELEVAEWQLRKQIGFLPEPGRIEIITVRGDSMYPDVKNGDVVMVDTATRYFDGDGLYLVNIHGHTFVKRLQLMTDGMHIISTNRRYSSQVIAPDELETLHVGGRIVGLALMRSAEEV